MSIAQLQLALRLAGDEIVRLRTAGEPWDSIREELAAAESLRDALVCEIARLRIASEAA